MFGGVLAGFRLHSLVFTTKNSIFAAFFWFFCIFTKFLHSWNFSQNCGIFLIFCKFFAVFLEFIHFRANRVSLTWVNIMHILEYPLAVSSLTSTDHISWFLLTFILRSYRWSPLPSQCTQPPKSTNSLLIQPSAFGV